MDKKYCRASLLIANMDCPMEEALIRKKLAGEPGVKNLSFNLVSRILTVDYEDGKLAEIISALKSIDMSPEEIEDGSENEAVISEAKIPWIKLAAAGFLALGSEICELFGEWSPGLASLKAAGFPLMQIFALAFALAAVVLGGLGTYKKGWIAVSNLNLNINALMSVAVTGAILIGQFPEAAMVMVLFNISEAIEALALDKARNNIKRLMDLAPQMVSVQKEGGVWEEVPVGSVLPGEIARVRPGEKVGLDGVIISGASEINQAPITGESVPVSKGPGDQVFSGAINEGGSFEFRVTAASDDSTLARIIHAVEEAQASRAPMQRFVDIFAKYYTPCVFILALIWALIPPLVFNTDWHQSIYTGLVLLVIGCPCAFVISTPVTVASGLAAAAKKGILIKGGLYLEQGRRMNLLALDKTGTITSGAPRLKETICLDKGSREKILTIAASLAERSDHPVSRAIAEGLRADGINPVEVENFKAIAGQGVTGEINGKTLALGNTRLLKALNMDSEAISARMRKLEEQGATVTALAGGDGAVALFAVADTVRESGKEAIRQLRELNIQTMMLTGDNEYTAQAIARECGVNEFRSNLLPEEKLAVIESLDKAGNVTGMAGDGINDAPALAKAGISFSMASGGSDTAIEVADVALMDDDLRKIPAFIRLSRKTYRILIENISIALGIKAVFFALTLAGSATMWMAVFADMGASLIVVANGLRNMGK